MSYFKAKSPSCQGQREGWGLLGCAKQGNVFSRIPCVLSEEPERLDRMPGVCDLPLRLATAVSLP